MSAFTAIDHDFMQRALVLAAQGLHTTQPNPRVGCVLVRDGVVVGEGWHQRAGEAHAEVHALRMAGERADGATAYVTLEPCGLHGRTPPCADALIRAGVRRVVIASEDAFQREGAAIARMRAAGIAVQIGLLRDEARELNVGFFQRIESGRPFVRLKLAMSLDGRTALASGESKWITGEAARADVQHWRARSSAIVTGIGTLLADDPALTVRWPDREFRPPLRVVLDSAARLSAQSRLASDGLAPSLRAHATDIDADQLPGVENLPIPRRQSGLDLQALLQALAQRGCNEVLVECGARLAATLLTEDLCDELLLYIAPVLLGDQARPLLNGMNPARLAEATRLKLIEQVRVGDDLRLRLRRTT